MTAAELLKKEEGIGALVSVKRGCWMYGLRKAVPQVISNLCMVGYLDAKVKEMILISIYEYSNFSGIFDECGWEILR